MIRQVVGVFYKVTDFTRFFKNFILMLEKGKILDLHLWNGDFLVAIKFFCVFKDIMNSEKSYDSLPNFTAADCKYYWAALLFSMSLK